MTLAPDTRAPRKRVALYEDVAERLRQKIYDYVLPPGEWIDEPALVAELGISRTPLRESLKLLAAEGLVQIEPGRGARVTRLNLEDLNELFPVMALLEGRCAYEAVRKVDAAGLARLETLHARMEQAADEGDLAEYYRQNYLIHESVQEFAGNPWLIRVTHDLHRILKMHRGRQLLAPGRMQQSLCEHRELMDCFRRGDAEGAERTMNRHLQSQGNALAMYVAAGGKLNVPAPLPGGRDAGPGTRDS
ncbi:GntR family transcriptional regulator [Xanthomonas translucens pv. translucens]|uniref:GntR family transcriptional regulator n=1 Tax=Xanthomonas campestris pv. translucens TaxID=343 RepID=UPI0019D5BF25|nr:GntR family transcriptional regulator [Xanthomonas translucens]MCT8287068.1 GntR family transcriptional regulator [Xanthomonas translucens pv. translucens]MCT8304726.1 GntR family transcriptional regulator [Xanthomonas translucens pv. translucens]QSQ31052.1 GntR family transcriptional regulator [Xanthomonas translucens pv. translucens]